MKLEHAVEQAVGHGTFVLVLSANADRLQALMKPVLRQNSSLLWNQQLIQKLVTLLRKRDSGRTKF